MKYYPVTVKEAAKFLKSDLSTVHTIIRSNGIPSVKVDKTHYIQPHLIETINDCKTYPVKLRPIKELVVKVKPNDDQRKRVMSACVEIGMEFPAAGLAKVFSKVVTQAIMDAFWHKKLIPNARPDHAEIIRGDAREYLTQPIIPHAEVFGINSDWIRRVLKEYFLLDNNNEARNT